jgi:hypothetical protein
MEAVPLVGRCMESRMLVKQHPGQEYVDIYIHSPIGIHGIVLK